jgi:hypothetical protein
VLRGKHLLIAVLPDELSAFEAYRLLQLHGISLENLALVGKGYTAPERVGLIEPSHIVRRYGRYGMVVLSALGLAIALGTALFLSVDYQWLWAVALAGLAVGAVVGLGVGMLYAVLFKIATAITCYNCLKQGQYLLIVEGSASLTRKGKEILSSYAVRPEL